MKNRRSILVLVILLAALTAANVLVRVRQASPNRSDARFLLDASKICDRLAIECRGNPTIRLARNQGWQLQEPYLANSDDQVVARLLDVLSFTPVLDVISESELVKLGRSYADFSLSEAELRLSARMEDGVEKTISFGCPTPSSDGIYACVSGLDAVLIVPSNVVAAIGVSASCYRRRSLFQMSAEDISGFDVKLGKGSTCSFVRVDDGWSSQAGQTSRQQIDKFLAELLSAKAVDFVWPVGSSNETDRVSASLLSGYGLDSESAITVSLKSRDGNVRQISFGKDGDGACTYAFVPEDPAVVTVPSALKEAAQQASTRFHDARLFQQDASAVVRISLVDGETKYALARIGERDWRLESPISAPADAGLVEQVLTRALGLSETDVQESGGVLLSLTTNVPPVRVAREKIFGMDRVDDFRAKEIVRIDPLSVKRLVRTETKGRETRTTAVVYDRGRRAWNVESTAGDLANVNAENVEQVLSALGSLKAIRVERMKVPAADLDKYGLGRPVFALAVDQDQERASRRNILVGNSASGGRYATVGSSDAVFVIADDVFEKLSTALLDR